MCLRAKPSSVYTPKRIGAIRRMAVFDDIQPWEDKLLLYAHQINWEKNLPVPTKADPERVEIAQEEPLRQECRHFIGCMSNGTQPITDGQEG